MRSGKAGSVCHVPSASGSGAPAGVLFGVGDGEDPLAFASAAQALPTGVYALECLPGGFQADEAGAALGFGLGSYAFDAHKGTGGRPRPAEADAAAAAERGAGKPLLTVADETNKGALRTLCMHALCTCTSSLASWLAAPAGLHTRADQARGLGQTPLPAALSPVLAGVELCRDLINTAPNAMGPAELAAATRALAAEHGAEVEEVVGDALLADYPMCHAVGRAASVGREPRVVDLRWGDESAPKVTLVGKGVCFDTGGLDVKPPSAMGNMKKDMGGAANALGLAKMVMAAGVDVRLRVLVCCAENAIAGNAFRPSDVLTAASGLTVEVGNTDAEGRLVIGDALWHADKEEPELLLDLTTLTGAHRVALGWDLPGVFTDDEALAAEIARHSAASHDPTWRLPLWKPYAKKLASKVADTNNISTGGLAGATTAALFLQKFVPRTAAKGWCHMDMNGWNSGKAELGKMGEGGEAQSIRAWLGLLKERYGTQSEA